MATKVRKSRVTHRICNVRRHTTGFVIDGKMCRRSTAVKLAQQGKLNGIQAVAGRHIQTLPSRTQKLYDLPEKVMPNFA